MCDSKTSLTHSLAKQSQRSWLCIPCGQADKLKHIGHHYYGVRDGDGDGFWICSDGGMLAGFGVSGEECR